MDRPEHSLNDLMARPRPSIFAAEAVLLFAAIGLWIASLLTARVAPAEGAAREFIFDALYYLPFVVMPIALYAARRPGLTASMRFNPMPPLSTLGVALAALISVYVASAADGLWALALNALGLHEPGRAMRFADSRALSLAILHAAAIPAVCEELLFRGFLFPAFERRGTGLAIWVSAAMFALMHGNVYGLPAYFLVGAVSAFLVFALDSLYAGIVYHTVYNAFILVALYLLPQTDEAAAPQPAMLMSVAIDALVLGALLYLILKSMDLRRRARGIEPVPCIGQPLRRGEWALMLALAAVFIGTSALVLMGV